MARFFPHLMLAVPLAASAQAGEEEGPEQEAKALCRDLCAEQPLVSRPNGLALILAPQGNGRGWPIVLLFQGHVFHDPNGSGLTLLGQAEEIHSEIHEDGRGETQVALTVTWKHAVSALLLALQGGPFFKVMEWTEAPREKASEVAAPIEEASPEDIPILASEGMQAAPEGHAAPPAPSRSPGFDGGHGPPSWPIPGRLPDHFHPLARIAKPLWRTWIAGLRHFLAFVYSLPPETQSLIYQAINYYDPQLASSLAPYFNGNPASPGMPEPPLPPVPPPAPFSPRTAFEEEGERPETPEQLSSEGFEEGPTDPEDVLSASAEEEEPTPLYESRLRIPSPPALAEASDPHRWSFPEADEGRRGSRPGAQEVFPEKNRVRSGDRQRLVEWLALAIRDRERNLLPTSDFLEPVAPLSNRADRQAIEATLREARFPRKKHSRSA